jgi:hypothetical protein
VHGEPPALLPGLPEFVSLLMARGVIPEVAIVGDRPFRFDSAEEAEQAARRRLWVNEGTAKAERITELLPAQLRSLDGGGVAVGESLAVGLVSWEPPGG